MKKHYAFPPILSTVIVLLLGLLFVSNISETKSLFTVVLDPLGLEPNLPEVPFQYSNIEFPNHLINTEWGQNDPGVLDFIDDDIATLGRVLFYDEILSANQNMACATCHSQARSFADEAAFSMGVDQETRRNSLHLNDLGWSNSRGFFWDLSQSDMSTMIALPLKDENEIGLVDIDDLADRMEDTNYYPELFAKAYNSSEISEERITDAITHFISSMNTFESKFDQVSRGDISYTSEEEQGHQLFESSCGICHSQGNSSIFFNDPNISLEDMINFAPFIFANGLEPIGDDLGVGEWLVGMDHLFKVPTLRNILQTAPYMHDGRFETIEEVIQHYSEDAIDDGWGFVPPGGFQFTENQKSDLLAFLETFTDESFLTEEKWSDPFDRESSNSELVSLESALLSPNPASDYSVIEFSNPNNDMIEVYLLDSNGRLIRKQSTHTNSVLIDVSHLTKGSYIVDIRNGEQKLTKSLIVI